MRGTISNPGKPSQTPLFLAVALHLGAFLLALAAPHLVPEKIRPPEVYRVELYNTTELPPPPPRQAAAIVETAPRTAPPVSKVAPAARFTLPKTKAAPPPLAKPAAKTAAVSLAPLKERLLKESLARQDKATNKRRLTDIAEQLKLDMQKRQADAQAREATRKAREAIAETYRIGKSAAPPAETDNPSSPRNAGSGVRQTTPAVALSGPIQQEILTAYKARLIAHIRRNWTLPVQQDWDKKNLAAGIIIKIKADGTVLTSWFEKNSGDTRFDQYVKKAVDRSSPLPALPPELGKNGEEIAVTFTPGGLK